MMMGSWNPKVEWNKEVEVLLVSCLGEERLDRISKSLTRPPLKLCVRANTLKISPEEVVKGIKEAMLSEEDGTKLLEKNPPPYVHPDVPMAVVVPGSGPHEIDYQGTEGKEIIVGRMAGESMLKGANGYAPGILALTSGIMKGDTVAVSVGVEVDGTNRFGVNRGQVLAPHIPLDDERFPGRKNLFIGTGIAELSRSDIDPSGKGLVVRMKDHVFSLPSLGNGMLKGKMMLQNLPSLVAAITLGPKPGSKVLDMCAAPGGKTTALAQIMENRGEIYALDRTHAKAANIMALCEELGITIVTALKADATKIYSKGKTFRIESGEREMTPGEKRIADRKAAANAKRGKVASRPVRARQIILRYIYIYIYIFTAVK